MPRSCRLPLVTLALLCCCPPAGAQLVADTVLTWPTYGEPGRCRVQIFRVPDDDERAHTVVLREVAENRGPLGLYDARHVAELVGRQYGIDPAAAYWVFHLGRHTYEPGQQERRHEVFLRATFRRTSGGGLGTPAWRLLTRAEVEALTDRLFR